MTPRLRHIASCLGLVAILGGGLVAPALHRAAHGIEHAHHAAGAAAQTDHVHAEGTAFTVSLDGVEFGHDLCLLCLPQPKTTAAPLATPAHFATARTFAPAYEQTAASVAEALVPIRGPPTIA